MCVLKIKILCMTTLMSGHTYDLYACILYKNFILVNENRLNSTSQIQIYYSFQNTYINLI